MKNLITIIACTLILLGFVSQFFANQMTHSRLAAIEDAIHHFQGQVRISGGLNDENVSELKNKLSNILECEEASIEVMGKEGISDRGQTIDFEVIIPKKNIFLAVDLWNLEEELKGDFSIARSTVSERVHSSL